MLKQRCYCVTSHHQPLVRREEDVPAPTGDQVLVKILGAGVCHSDIHIWEGEYDLGGGKKMVLKDRGVSLPLVMGHEIAGEVAAVGKAVQSVKVGDKVLVAIGVGNQRAGVVRDDQLRHAFVESQGPGHRPDPVLQLLAGAPVLAHRALEPPGKGLVVLAELRVAPGPPMRVLGHVLLPQQHQGHALAVELAVHAPPVGHDVGEVRCGPRQQPPDQLAFIELTGRSPVQGGGRGQPQVLGHDALRYLQGPGDRLVRHPRLVLEANHILDHA